MAVRISMSEEEKELVMRLFAASHFLLRSVNDYSKREIKELLDEIDECSAALKEKFEL